MVSLLALVAALAAAALLIARPWEDNSMAPQLSVSPGLGIGVADSVPVAPGRPVALAAAVPAPNGVAVLAAKPVPAAGGSGSAAPIAIAPARALASPAPSAPQPPAPAPISGPEPEPAVTPVSAPAPQPSTELVADQGETSTAPGTAPETGGRPPVVTRGMVGDGRTARVIRVNGEQPGSELILGDAGTGAPTQIAEGGEYALSFSFDIGAMAYGEPGADNVMVEFLGDAGATRTLGLQLWQNAIADPLGVGRGLWASGEAAGGDRFLAPLTERAWHDLEIDFRVSAQGAGFYAVLLDGEMVDVRGGVSLIPGGSASAQIGIGLLRDPTRVQGSSELRLGPATLEPLEP
ncbi:MAG TPA: hypothetical protein VH476_03140 [Solirubrobacterales bacterium]